MTTARTIKHGVETHVIMASDLPARETAGDERQEATGEDSDAMTAERQQDWFHRIQMARQLIESRLAEDIPLDELAAAVHSSPFHFHRMFRGMTGETVRDYSRRLRLERAAQHLIHSDADILTIALDVGYDSHEAFTRAFKRHFGVAPSVFRSEKRDVTQHAGDDSMTTVLDVHIERHEAKRIAYVRHVGPYSTVSEAWKAIMKWGWSKMLFGKAETFGLCFDDPDVTPAERLRYEACMVVGDRVRPKNPVAIRTIPATTYAVTIHHGGFDTISATYARLCAHVCREPIEGLRWQLSDPPSMERYLRDPRKVAPEEMRTEILMPVARSQA